MFYRVFVPHRVDGVMVESGRIARTLQAAVRRAQRSPGAEVRPYGQNITVWRMVNGVGLFFMGQARDAARDKLERKLGAPCSQMASVLAIARAFE